MRKSRRLRTCQNQLDGFEMHECVEKKHHKDGFVQFGCAPIIHCMDLKFKAEHIKWMDLSLAWIEKALITNLS